MSDCKTIVAAFLKVAPEEILPGTLIDRSALHGSIIVSRMHAKLAQAGYRVRDWRMIRTYGDLERDLGGEGGPVEALGDAPSGGADAHQKHGPGIGIDIEELTNLPSTTDYREHPFYRETFTAREIAYCILQGNPLASFTGLFAAKEAIVKAEGGSAPPLSKIEIAHDQRGKPCADGYELSISHSGTLAVAVAIKLAREETPANSLIDSEAGKVADSDVLAVDQGPYKSLFFLAVLFLLGLSLVIVFLVAHRA